MDDRLFIGEEQFESIARSVARDTEGLRMEFINGSLGVKRAPDGVLVPLDAFVGQGEWASVDGIRMVVEVTSYDEDTDRRDRVEKLAAYAHTGLPVYLLIDRDTCEMIVHSEPDGERYEAIRTVPFGKSVELPSVGIVLDTEPLKNWVR